MEDENKEGESPIDEIEFRRPKLSFKTITFSDGTILELDNDDIVVFVGPNNAGKSAALRELKRMGCEIKTRTRYQECYDNQRGDTGRSENIPRSQGAEKRRQYKPPLRWNRVQHTSHEPEILRQSSRSASGGTILREATEDGRTNHRLQCSARYRALPRSADPSDPLASNGPRLVQGHKRQIQTCVW